LQLAGLIPAAGSRSAALHRSSYALTSNSTRHSQHHRSTAAATAAAAAAAAGAAE